MNSLDLVTKIYKPYKVTKISNATILKCTNGTYVVKNKKNK